MGRKMMIKQNRRSSFGENMSGSSRKSLECSDGGEYFFESAASIGTRENAYPPVGNARAAASPAFVAGLATER